MIQLNHIHKAFGKKVIFDQMSATFDQPGKVYAILGASGSGKTTLLHMLFGLDRDFTGSYTLFGRNASELTNRDWDGIRSSRMQLVYQDDKLLGDFTVEDNLKFALNDPHQGEEAIRQALARMDLLELSHQKVKKLSGGEKQRLALARAALNHPEILLLDEPTGNLDDANTHIVMEYVQKLAEESCMVILITHDSRVMEYADVLYHLEQKKILEIDRKEKSASVLPIIPSLDWSQSLPKRRLLGYAWKSVRCRVSDLILHNIPITAIFIVFVLLFNLVLGMTHVVLDMMMQGIDNQSILIDLGNFKDAVRDEYNAKGITLAAGDGKRLHFTQGDLEQVKAMEGVEDAIVLDSGSYRAADVEFYSLELAIPLEEFPDTVKNQPGAMTTPDTIEFGFASLSVPPEYLPHYNPDHITLLAGEYPQAGTDQVLIPDVLAYYQVQQQNSSLTQLVGQEIQFPVEKGIWEGDNYLGVDTKEKTYSICGIYHTDYQQSFQPDQTVYVGYMDTSITPTEEWYQQMKEMNYDAMNPQSQAVCQGIYQDYEHYVAAYGTGYKQMLVIAQSPEEIPQVSAQLDEMLPHFKQLSQYDAKHGEMAALYRYQQGLFFSIMAILVVLFGIIITFLTKGHIKRKNKQMSILYSLGYSRWQVSRIILYENLMQTALDLAVAYLVVVPVYLCWLQYSTVYKYFGQTLTVTSILGVCGFGVLMMAFSIAWAVFGVRKKKLKKYLSG